MKRDVMSVRLWLPRIEVLGVVADTPACSVSGFLGQGFVCP